MDINLMKRRKIENGYLHNRYVLYIYIMYIYNNNS